MKLKFSFNLKKQKYLKEKNILIKTSGNKTKIRYKRFSYQKISFKKFKIKIAVKLLKTFIQSQLINLEKENTQEMKPNKICPNCALHKKNIFILVSGGLSGRL